MESMAHSRQPNKVSVTLSSKINNGGFSYDDVYGGPPPKFGVSSLSPRFEDYGEIFGSFKTARASSIPLLDLPVVDETDAFFDPRSSAFNYGEVFGALDFAVSFEDLVDQPNALDGVSSEEAWTPAETDSFSGDSDHYVNNQSMSNGDLFQSVYGSTEFNISYHQVNGTGNEQMLKEKTHMNQLHAVPGFPPVYDEPTQLSRNDPSFQVTDDIDLDMDFSADKVNRNHIRKTVPHLPNFTSGEQTFGSDLNLHNECSRNGSHSSEMFITVSDISLRSMPSPVPPPSRPPPVLDAKKGDTCGYFSNNGWVTSKETPSDNSPPFFDVEVDMTSSAAPSAAAMQETMHRAEAKLRCAKELEERKKGVYESRVKPSYDVENNDAKMNKNMTRLNSSNDEAVQETCDRTHRRNSKTKISVTDERQKSRKACAEILDTLEGKLILNMLEVKHTKESKSLQDLDRSTGVGTWKEETELFELVGTEESGKVIQPTKPSKIFVQDTRTHEHGQKEREASNMNMIKEVYEHDKNIRRSKASNDECRQIKQEENEKNIRKVYQHGKTEKKVTEADLRSLEDLSEMRDKEHKQAENEKSKERQTPSEVQLGVRLKENAKKLKKVENQQQSVKKQNQFEQMKESGKRPIEAFSLGQAEDEENLKDSVELEDIDERSNEAFKQDNTDEKDGCRREEIEKTPEGCSKNEESDEGLKHALGWEETEKRLQEEFELEVNEIRMKDAFRQRENDRRENWAYERDQNQKKLEEVWDEYREGNRLKEAGDNEGIQKVLNQAPDKEWSGGILNEVQTKKEIESSLNQIFDREGSVKVSNEDIYPEQSENMVKDVGRKENDKGLHKALDQMEGSKEEENMKFAKATDKTWEIESEENLLAAQLASSFAENIGKLEVSQESVADQKIGKIVTECKVGGKKLEEIGVENQLANENIGAPEMTTRDAEHSVYQSGKVDESVKKADDRRRIETAEPATVQESVNVQKTTQWLHVGQSTERKENNVSETPATVGKDPERMRREIESEKDRLRKIEEEKDRETEREKDRIAVDKAMLEAEREREREKDRMAVDRATFEACERAQRAAFERATVEARQRALVDARERLEKACAEARSYTDKATTEARLKAERAAVERATAEAQERAMEKLKVERAVFESRERLERSVSDKFGVCSSDMLDPQFQNFSSSMGTKYPYSVYGEREGESAQRCRARLERHRRTAERAAKALAEKNMRDLLAQKEQAERNRLAETLDAEVRRWSSGKEGNLRALLSTLQYILGPDCGWQSIPLTEVITSAAVKKAYRKATLCVHPDKLQQRGASIQHKYICEKVFDLLKEAWNKFNNEER